MPKTHPRDESLVQLCSGVLPVWERHLAVSRSQSEAAVNQIVQAFSDLQPGLLKPIPPHPVAGDIAEAGFVTVDVSLLTRCDNLLSSLLQSQQLKPDGMEALAEAVRLLRNARPPASGSILGAAADSTGQHVADSPVERMYKGLQFQDRIGQMLALLEADMQRLREALQSPGAHDTTLAHWLERLESQYVMSDQRAAHEGAGTSAEANSSDETTFF